MICRGSELDNLLLVLLLVLVAHQTKFQQICFNEVVFLVVVVVGDTWMSRARQRSMKTVRHGRIPVRSKWLVFWSLQGRFSVNRAHGGSLRRARGPGGTSKLKAGTGSFCNLPGGADRHDSRENQGLQWNSTARLQQCASPTSKCRGKDACGDGRDWLALVISSACDCDRNGLQPLRLPGSLAENGMAAGIMLRCFGAPVMVRRRRRPRNRVASWSTGQQ